jgi:isopentenyldiphosphate isomerase
MKEDERVAVLDKAGKIIGYKNRGELTDNDCWRVICVWIENSQSQVLLQQRTHTRKINPGLWTNAVIGTVTHEDTYDQTAEREIQEEIGLSGVKLVKTHLIHYKASLGWRWVQGYTATCNWPVEKFVLQAEEVLAVAWVDKQQLLAELTGKAPQSRPYPVVCTMWPKLFNLV